MKKDYPKRLYITFKLFSIDHLLFATKHSSQNKINHREKKSMVETDSSIRVEDLEVIRSILF